MLVRHYGTYIKPIIQFVKSPSIFKSYLKHSPPYLGRWKLENHSAAKIKMDYGNYDNSYDNYFDNVYKHR